MDEAKFWVRDHHIARVPHTCELCGRTIDPGERYLYGTGFGDTFWHWKECANCEWMQTTFDIQWDGMYNAEMFQEFEPWDVTELRAKAGYLMKWRTRSGALIPVPTTEHANGSK